MIRVFWANLLEASFDEADVEVIAATSDRFMASFMTRQSKRSNWRVPSKPSCLTRSTLAKGLLVSSHSYGQDGGSRTTTSFFSTPAERRKRVDYLNAVDCSGPVNGGSEGAGSWETRATLSQNFKTAKALGLRSPADAARPRRKVIE